MQNSVQFLHTWDCKKLTDTHPTIFCRIIYYFETRLKYIPHIQASSYKKK
jgi:hypothetical protein